MLKRNSRVALDLARELSSWLTAQELQVLAEPEVAGVLGAQALSHDVLARNADLIVVLGGDGTLLGVARAVGERETPILGINLGGLGFLTAVPVGKARASLAGVIAGDYEVDRRITLEARVESDQAQSPRAMGTGQCFNALNDVAINKLGPGRLLELDVVAGGEPFCSYRGDGIIVATPTGSTAYALSAGGPIVFPTLEAMVLVPICPHTLSNRPVVLPDSFEIEIRVKTDDHGAILTADGQESTRIGAAELIRVRRGRNFVTLVRSPHSYFEAWRDKLRWG